MVPGDRCPMTLARPATMPEYAESNPLPATEGHLWQKHPNILVIWGDDIGQSNLSCYSNGLLLLRLRWHERRSATVDQADRG